MKTFREHSIDSTNEMSVRDVNDKHGHLEELKFGKVHVAFTETKDGVTINSTANTLALNKKEIKELIDALKHFV